MIHKGEVTLKVGEAGTGVARQPTGAVVSWASSNPAVATVEPETADGRTVRVLAHAPGDAVITCDAGPVMITNPNGHSSDGIVIVQR